MNDRTDFSEVILQLEDLFGTEFPSGTEDFATPRAIVDWFEIRLLGWGPNAKAAAVLQELAHSRNNPKLAEGLHDTWRREQIDAIVRDLFGR